MPAPPETFNVTYVTENKPFTLPQSRAPVSFRTMRILPLAIILLAASLPAQQPRTFDWVKASDEAVQLDPMDFHAGRVYRPGPDGGNIHVIIHARKPITLALTSASEWNNAQLHPELLGNLEYRCLRQHVVDTTYECHLAPSRPMVLLLRDERTPDRAIFQSIGVIIGKASARQLISPNDVLITYHSWECVESCIQPEYRWIRVVKEKYQLSSAPKLYSVVTPTYDGQRTWVRIKAPMPVTIALLPSRLADEAFDSSGALSSALSQTTCKQRGVQSMEFECKLNRGEGPQSLILVSDSPIRSHKKSEIEFQTLQCIANCEMIPSDGGDNR